MTFAERLLAPLAAIALVCAAPIARAEPTAADLASARALFKEGRDLRAKGDIAGALEKLRAAHALGQTPITGIELARTFVLARRLLEAREVCIGVARLPVASDETDRSSLARADAAKLATELEPRLATLVVTMQGSPSAGAGAPRLAIDGEPLPAAAMGEPRWVDPGAHVAVMTLDDGVQVRAEVTLQEGERRTLALSPPPREAPPPVAPPVATPSPEPASSAAPPSRAPPRLLLIGGASVAVAGAVVGTLYGLDALSGKSTLDGECPLGRCGPSAHGDLQSARTSGTISTIAFVVAGAGVVAVVIDLLRRPDVRARASTALVPDLGAGWVGAHGSF